MPTEDQLLRLEEGLVGARVISDPDLYRVELERIFARSWLFVAHESEIPNPGDFVTRWMGEDPVIVSRAQDGSLHVMLNVCRHRGRKVCTEDAGNSSHFRCGYHGWTYSAAGELTGVPFLDAYQGKLDRASLGLCQAGRVDSYQGLIFATWDEHAQPLREFLGDIAWVLDVLFGRTAGMQVVGPPMRWTVDANWKLGATNFTGDAYHLPTTHGYGAALGMDVTRGRRAGYTLSTENAHAANINRWPEGNMGKPYLSLPEHLRAELESRLTPDQLEVMRSMVSFAGNVFPNFSYLNIATVGFLNTEWRSADTPAAPDDSKATSFLTIRQWQPKGVDKMEIWSWQLMDRDVPDWWRESSIACYTRSFGMAGMHEQDDIENWSAISEGCRGPMGRAQWLNYQMRLGEKQAPADWPGPGEADYLYPMSVSDRNERAFYHHWQELMERP
ncbi:MAG TPA: Rieske 2Fe-2S domain-containing protein [Chloroflexota bacterium]|nr:Rieske 2Fe-2S domain-containing protein [Chloroflexota bacterium]